MKKTFLILIVFTLLNALFLVIFYQKGQPTISLDKNPSSFTIKDCEETNFARSLTDTPLENQKTCALLMLENAEPIVITDTKIGDTSLSIIKALAEGDLDRAGNYKPTTETLNACLEEAGQSSNAAVSGCLYDVEESLQRKIRSMVLLQIQEEEKMLRSPDDASSAFIGDSSKEYWRNWYVSTTNKNSTKAAECDIEGTKSGGSGWYQLMPACYIQQDANEILWLLRQKQERWKFFHEVEIPF